MNPLNCYRLFEWNKPRPKKKKKKVGTVQNDEAISYSGLASRVLILNLSSLAIGDTNSFTCGQLSVVNFCISPLFFLSRTVIAPVWRIMDIPIVGMGIGSRSKGLRRYWSGDICPPLLISLTRRVSWFQPDGHRSNLREACVLSHF